MSSKNHSTHIENERIILFTSKDVEVFFRQIDNPPKPNKKLRQAVKRYKESVILPRFNG